MEFKIGKTYTFSPADYNAEKDEAHKKEYGYSEYDMIDKDGYVICMVGESVTLVDTDDSFVVLFNDNNGATKETFKISKEKFNRDFCINSVDLRKENKTMETILLKLYKVTWKHTANSYVVCKEWDQEKVMKELEKEDGRCDDIVGIEEVFLPAFDGDNMRKNDYVRLFLNLNIL